MKAFLCFVSKEISKEIIINYFNKLNFYAIQLASLNFLYYLIHFLLKTENYVDNEENKFRKIEAIACSYYQCKEYYCSKH